MHTIIHASHVVNNTDFALNVYIMGFCWGGGGFKVKG